MGLSRLHRRHGARSHRNECPPQPVINNDKNEKIKVVDEAVDDTGVSAPRNQLFACPFHQNNPARPGLHRTCLGPGWDTVHRLKEHLMRKHIAQACTRCSATFHSRPVMLQHLLECMAGPVPSDRDAGPWLDPDAQMRLRIRGGRNLNAEEGWKNVYMIIFPATHPDRIPSPYYQFHKSVVRESNLEAFQIYLETGLSPSTRRHIEQKLGESLLPDNGPLNRAIVDIFADLVLQLLKDYQKVMSDSKNLTADCENVVAERDIALANTLQRPTQQPARSFVHDREHESPVRLRQRPRRVPELRRRQKRYKLVRPKPLHFSDFSAPRISIPERTSGIFKHSETPGEALRPTHRLHDERSSWLYELPMCIPSWTTTQFADCESPREMTVEVSASLSDEPVKARALCCSEWERSFARWQFVERLDHSEKFPALPFSQVSYTTPLGRVFPKTWTRLSVRSGCYNIPQTSLNILVAHEYFAPEFAEIDLFLGKGFLEKISNIDSRPPSSKTFASALHHLPSSASQPWLLDNPMSVGQGYSSRSLYASSATMTQPFSLSMPRGSISYTTPLEEDPINKNWPNRTARTEAGVSVVGLDSLGFVPPGRPFAC